MTLHLGAFREVARSHLPPPIAIDGSKEKVYPYCLLTFPSNLSCSHHIHEQHMVEACAPHAQAAAEKEAREKTTTNHQQWSPSEIEHFKAALTQFGPGSNIKNVEAIGTRSAAQANIYKHRFLKKNPTWVAEHPRQRPGLTQGSAPSTPPSSPSELADGTVTHPTPPLARVSERQYCSPEVGVAHRPPLTPAAATPVDQPTVGLSPVEEERTPLPPPVPESEECALRIQRLDQALKALRSNPVAPWDPDAPCFSPPPAEMGPLLFPPNLWLRSPQGSTIAQRWAWTNHRYHHRRLPRTHITPTHISASLLRLI